MRHNRKMNRCRTMPKPIRITKKDRVLQEIIERPGQTATEIAHRLHFGVDEVSSMLSIYTKRHTVFREKNPNDKRRGFEYYIIKK